MRPFDWAPGVTALPIFLIVAVIFVRLVFFFFIIFLFVFFQLYFAYCHTSYTRASGSDTQGNLIPRININIKLIDTCIICIARKGPDICLFIKELFMQRPLRHLWNLICLLFLYILFVLPEIQQNITFLTKGK